MEVRTTKYLGFITEQNDNCNMPFFLIQSEMPLSRRVARSKVAVRKVLASREAHPHKDQENILSQGKPTFPAGKIVHCKKPWRDWSKDSKELALKEVKGLLLFDVLLSSMMYRNRPFMIELLVKLTLVPKSDHHATLMMKKKN